MSATNEVSLELQDAADALGVHYQTAYRWVRSGRLPARLVGGRYHVAQDDIAQFDSARRAPSTPRPPSGKRLQGQGERMFEALVSGDEAHARSITSRLLDDGTDVVELLQRVLVPALRRIGAAWRADELPIWAEHRASTIAHRLLAELSPNPRGRRRGVVAVATVSGDHHSLPTSMAAVALRSANWSVHHIGVDTPPRELMGFCMEHSVDLAVLTVTNPDAIELTEHTADALRAAGVPTIVGGPGRTLDDLLGQARDAASRARRLGTVGRPSTA